MSYKDSYDRVYKALIRTKTEFNLQKATLIAFKECSNSLTKKEIISLTIEVINEGLDNGIIKAVKVGVYQSTLAQTKNKNLLK